MPRLILFLFMPSKPQSFQPALTQIIRRIHFNFSASIFMPSITTRHFFHTAGTLLAGLVLVACGKQEPQAPAASAPAPATRVVVVGTDAAYAPFESQNEKGEIVGFDIDVVKAVAKKAGIEVKFLNTPWEGIFNSLGQGDRDLLFLAVHNLLDNAIKFTQPGGTIEMRGFEDGSSLVIEVADTGQGIPEDELVHVGEELYRARGARGIPGNGLGLALVHSIINLHGGKVSVRSREGKGTVVTLKLPVNS